LGGRVIGWKKWSDGGVPKNRWGGLSECGGGRKCGAATQGMDAEGWGFVGETRI